MLVSQKVSTLSAEYCSPGLVCLAVPEREMVFHEFVHFLE